MKKQEIIEELNQLVQFIQNHEEINGDYAKSIINLAIQSLTEPAEGSKVNLESAKDTLRGESKLPTILTALKKNIDEATDVSEEYRLGMIETFNHLRTMLASEVVLESNNEAMREHAIGFQKFIKDNVFLASAQHGMINMPVLYTAQLSDKYKGQYFTIEDLYTEYLIALKQ